MEFKEILESALANVPDTIDKQEGSIVYTTIAPVAYELAKAYWVISWLTNLIYPDTSEGEWLDRITDMFGLTRKPATNAIRRIFTYNQSGAPMTVPVGSRFRIEDLSLEIIEQIAVGQYKAKAEQSGIVGNQYNGPCLAISNIADLGSVMLDEVMIQAVDQELDEELRERFYTKVRTSPFGGNIADYEQGTLGIEGVGAVKVFPIWNGPGTVLLIIGDESQRSATNTLVERVQEVFQPAGNQHSGKAPIGAIVTVATSTSLTINISAAVIVDTGASFVIVKPLIEAAIREYIKGITFTDSIVYLSRLTVAMLNVEGVVDVRDVKINGATSNLALSKTAALYQVPSLGTIALTEVAK